MPLLYDPIPRSPVALSRNRLGSNPAAKCGKEDWGGQIFTTVSQNNQNEPLNAPMRSARRAVEVTGHEARPWAKGKH